MKIGIGSAQFGLDYGVSNHSGKTLPSEVKAILQDAFSRGIHIVDTAPAYGDSESVLGEMVSQVGVFSIITKTPIFSGRPIGKRETDHLEAVFNQSLERLRVPCVEALLLHHGIDCMGGDGMRLIRQMQSLKERGLVRKIGISVYESSELDAVMQDADVDLVQVPLNVFDQRLLVSGHLQLLKRRNIEVHARSIFLQGVLLMPVEMLPDNLQPLRRQLSAYHRFAKERGLDPLSAALSFINSVPEVDVVICGINCAAQLREIAKCIPARDNVQWAEFAVNDSRLLNPALWRG